MRSEAEHALLRFEAEHALLLLSKIAFVMEQIAVGCGRWGHENVVAIQNCARHGAESCRVWSLGARLRASGCLGVLLDLKLGSFGPLEGRLWGS